MARRNRSRMYAFKSIAREFGISEKKLHSEYNVFQRKLQNFNRINKTNYNPLMEFRFSKIAPNNSTIQAIQQTTSVPWRQLSKSGLARATNIGLQYNIGKFQGLINNSGKLQKDLESVGKVPYHTLKWFVNRCKNYAKKLKTQRRTDPLISSDSFEWDDDSAVEMDTLEEINNADLPF